MKKTRKYKKRGGRTRRNLLSRRTNSPSRRTNRPDVFDPVPQNPPPPPPPPSPPRRGKKTK